MQVTRNVTYVVRIVYVYNFKAPVCVFDRRVWVENAEKKRQTVSWNEGKDGFRSFDSCYARYV